MAAPEALRFALITLAEAQRIYLAREREYSRAQAGFWRSRSMTAQIDLNCDMGESFGPWKMGNDVAILDHVTSANIACGFHAGDPLTMQRVVQAALDKGVKVGAHPGFPDLVGFGRRNLQVTPDGGLCDGRLPGRRAGRLRRRRWAAG